MTRRSATKCRAMGALASFTLVASAGPVLAGCVGAGDDNPFFASVDASSGDAGDARAAAGDTGDAHPDARTDSGLREAEASVVDASGDATLPPEGDSARAGTVNPARVAFSATEVDLGPVACGAAGTGTLRVTNNGMAQLSLSATATAVSRGAVFTVSPTRLVLAQGVSGTLNITLRNLPQATHAGTSVLGALSVVTNDPGNASVPPIPLRATATGATLAYQRTGQQSVDFPTTKVGTPSAAVSFALVNIGNGTGTFMATNPSSPAFSLAGASAAGVSVTLSPGETWLLTAGFTPTTATNQTASSSISFDAASVLCGDNLTGIVFNGTGTQANLTGAPSSSLKFPARCGGAAPTPQSFTLENNGTVDARITATTTGPFSLLTPSTSPIVIPGGGSTNFTVTALPYPDQSAAMATKMPPPMRGSLVLVSDASTEAGADAGAASGTIVVPLEEDPVGAVLNLAAADAAHSNSPTPFNGSFDPVVVLQQSPPHALDVTNGGNAPANVTLAIVADAADAGAPAPFALLGSNAAGAAAFTLPAAPMGATSSVQPESIAFAPTVAGGNVASLVLTVDPATVLCGALPSAVKLSGLALGFGPSISTTDLRFPAPCDGTTVPTAQTFSVANAGMQDMSWWLSDITGPGVGRYVVTAVTDASVVGSVQPGVVHLLHKGETSSVTIGLLGAMASARAGASAPSPEALAAQLTISTDVHPDTPHVISLHEVPLGDRLRVVTRALSFGPSAILAPAASAQAFSIRNDASPDTPVAFLTLTASNPSVFPVLTSPLALPPGGNAAASVAFAPAAAIAYAETLGFTTTDLLCEPLPQSLLLTGTGMRGQPVVSTTQLAFGAPGDPLGLVNCGSTGTPKTFTVSNTGTQPFNITTLALEKGAASPFSLQVPTPLPIVANPSQSVTITVVPNPIPQSLPAAADVNNPAAYGDRLQLTTDSANDTAHFIDLLMQPQGAIITGAPPLNTTWNFGTVGFGSIATLPNAFTNIGNSAASVALSGLSYPSVFTLANSAIPPGGGVTAIVAEFAPAVPNGSWVDQGTLTLTSSTTFCEALPAQWGGGPDGGTGASALIHLNGSSEGSQPPVTFSGGLAFGATKCGSAPPGPLDVTLTNNTNQTYDVTASLRFGAHYRVAIGGQTVGTAALSPFGRTTITVSPQPVVPGQGVLSGSDAYADSLAVTVGPLASPVATSVIPISWALSGAVLSLPSGAGDHSAGGASFYAADTRGRLLPIANGGTETVSVSITGSLVTASPDPIDVVGGGGAPALLFSTGDAQTCPAQLDASPVLTTVTLGTPPGAAICQPFVSPVVKVFSCAGASP